MNDLKTQIQALENVLNYHNKQGAVEDAERVKAEIEVLKTKLPKEEPVKPKVEKKTRK